MARKGQGIEILSGWQDAVGGEDFLRELVQGKRVVFPSGMIVVLCRRWCDGISWSVGSAGSEAPFR